MTKDSSKGLGKGLEALFEETGSAFANVYEGKSAFTSYTEEERKNASEMSISDIYANPNQPRKNFDDQAMHIFAAKSPSTGGVPAASSCCPGRR